MFKMESNVNDANIKHLEFSRAFRWDARTVGQGSSNRSNEGDQLLAKGQDMGPSPTKLEVADSSEGILYYGVNIPNDANVSEADEALHVYTDKSEAMKIVKKHKKARFKLFSRREEAVEFAVHGSEILPFTSPGLSENLETSNPAVGEKPSPFKGPKAQDLVRLRKMIERGDIYTFRTTVWDNPRYLISSGDTPAILQEGSRYNALHVAAKACNAELCSLILQTVSNVAFIQLLYGDDDSASCQDRAHILLDLYLNTPDKALNETALHFAVKFGAARVVDVLVSYPQCDKHARNKFGQTPRDVICSRVSSPDEGLRQELSNLLDDRFYVPVLRSEDNSIQPAVGEPFSAACPLALKADPVNPRMEIWAYAGPMDREKAVVFRKKWKTPPRMPWTPNRNASKQAYVGSPSCHAVRLLDVEKGLERAGRDLAQEFDVGWNEYWPFLDTFTNLASQDGLQKLEAYLKNRFQEAGQKPNHHVISDSGREKYESTKYAMNGCPLVPAEQNKNESSDDGTVSPVSDLCFAFKACSLSDDSPATPLVQNETKTASNMYSYQSGDAEADVEDEALLNPGLSPFLYVEKSCQVFGKRIYDGLTVAGNCAHIGDSVSDMLWPEIKHLQDLVRSFKDDTRFISVDFNLVHSRIAAIIAEKLVELASDDMEFLMSGLKSTLSSSSCSYSDEEDSISISYRNTHRYAEDQRKTGGERNQIKCITKLILSALEQEETVKETNRDNSATKNIHVRTEEECMRIWSDAIKCSCFRQDQNFMRNARKGSSFKRSQNVRNIYPTSKANTMSSLDGITRRLTFDDSDQQCSGKRTGEMAGSSHKELSFRTAKQRTHSVNKKQTSSMSEVDKLHEAVDIFSSSHLDHHLLESDNTSDDEDEYFTPPSTPRKLSSSESEDADSDDDGTANMSTPDEGPDVFIQGDSPSKLDVAVLQALDGSAIGPLEYPNIYRWRHLVLLHSEHERATWPSAFGLGAKERSRNVHSPEATSGQYQINTEPLTPPQAWHKITGPYSPLCSQQCERNMDHI